MQNRRFVLPQTCLNQESSYIFTNANTRACMMSEWVYLLFAIQSRFRHSSMRFSLSNMQHNALTDFQRYVATVYTFSCKCYRDYFVNFGIVVKGTHKSYNLRRPWSRSSERLEASQICTNETAINLLERAQSFEEYSTLINNFSSLAISRLKRKFKFSLKLMFFLYCFFFVSDKKHAILRPQWFIV